MKLSQLKADYAQLERYVDVEDGLNRIRNNKKVYRMVMNSFIRETHYEELCAQLARRDAEAVRVASHTIKGLAANLSLPALLEMTVEFESRLKAAGAGELPQADELGKTLAKTVEYIGIVLEHLDEI